jgi:ubiquitin-like-conjugating enzyme ATG10
MMTAEEFQRQATALCTVLQKWDGVYDQGIMQWKMEKINGDNDSYLIHPLVLRKAANASSFGFYTSNSADDEYLEEEWIHHDDDEYIIPSCEKSNVYEWRYSIVYSFTWRVPVLYFTVQTPSGSPCPRDEVLSMLPGSLLQQDSWDFLSYDEHPVTGVPSFFLHPCQTQNVLNILRQDCLTDTKLELLSWLSLIIPSIGYSLPSTLFQEIRQELTRFNM